MMILSSKPKPFDSQQHIENDPFVRRSDSYTINSTFDGNKSYPLQGRKIALISGAGLSGLTAAFELNAKGYDVVIAEKRDTFSRSNIINLNKEVESFLNKFNLLDEFKTSVAARIQEHEVIAFENADFKKKISETDVSEFKFEGHLENDPLKFKGLFMESGIYSVQIKDLQAFLAQKARQLGILILGNAEVKILSPLTNERVSKVEIKQNLTSTMTLNPDLFFIAEGTRSKTALDLKMTQVSDEVINDCTGENWIFGNLKYQGDKTCVVSMVTTKKTLDNRMEIEAQKTLEIANVIFNAKSKTVNVAVTIDEHKSQDEIDNLILQTAGKAFSYKGIKEPLEIIDTVKEPVHIKNRMASICSKGNVFPLGDAIGNSSPLAGLGGTLSLTLVPITVQKLLDDIEKESDKTHDNFKLFSQSYVQKWIDKSQHTKAIILNIFNQKPPKEAQTNDLKTKNRKALKCSSKNRV